MAAAALLRVGQWGGAAQAGLGPPANGSRPGAATANRTAGFIAGRTITKGYKQGRYRRHFPQMKTKRRAKPLKAMPAACWGTGQIYDGELHITAFNSKLYFLYSPIKGAITYYWYVSRIWPISDPSFAHVSLKLPA